MPQEDAAVTEPSISDLRALLNPPAEPETPTEAPAPAKAEKSEPAPEPAVTEEAVGAERDETGKFKAAVDAPGVAKRIGKALQAQREAEQRVRELEARLANPGSQPVKETAPPVAPGKPAAANFDTYEAYVEALADWKLDVRDAQRANAEASRKQAETYTTREAAVKVAHPDFDDVMADAAAMPISRTMHDAIGQIGPELAYFFATNPDETARIATLGPLDALLEIGAIKAKLAAPSASSKTAKPAAAAKPLPRPPAAVGGSHAPSVVDLNDPDLDMATFKREFRKRLAT